MTALNILHQTIISPKPYSFLDRTSKKMPVVSEEAQADIEQAITEGRAEIARKRSKLSF